MDADDRPKTVRIRFAKRMSDGKVWQSAPLYDSFAGLARAARMRTCAWRLMDERRAGTLASPALWETDPNYMLAAYMAAAYEKHKRGEGELPFDTMTVGDDSWQGDIRVVEDVVLDLDALEADDRADRDSIDADSVAVWTC